MNELASYNIQNEAGGRVAFGSLWRDQPAVAVFVRHFGCVFCQEQVQKLADRAADFQALGVELAVIGNGTANFIAGFRDKSGFVGAIYTDPERGLYKRLGFKRSKLSSLRPGVVAAGIRAYREGYRQTSVQGDPWQQGGVAIFNTGGNQVYSYISKYAGDHPDVQVLVDEASRVAAGREAAAAE